ncbi:MAG: hypothetical protein ACOC8F_03890 [Planctomycetota bacterium]
MNPPPEQSDKPDSAPQDAPGEAPPAPGPAATESRGGSSRSRWVRYGLILAIVTGAVAVYLVQIRGKSFPEWRRDIDAALEQARRQKRPVLAYFVHTTSSTTVREQWRTALSRKRNRDAIQAAQLIRVVADIDLDSPTAERFGIEHLPTMLILSDQGRECKRSENLIGQLPFRTQFLEPDWSGWRVQRDPSGSLPTATAESPVLALFTTEPSGGAARRMAYTTFASPDVRDAIDEMGVRKVHVALNDARPKALHIARAHEIDELPTLLLRTGGETIRRTGYVSTNDLLELLRTVRGLSP